MAGEKKPKKEKAEKASAEAVDSKKGEAKQPERPPADPRLKVVKKFKGRFLPKGPLRDRHREILARWNSGEDHGGVTFEELKTLFEDWKATRVKTRVSS